MHEWVDHTSEVELHVRAPSREAVFGEATAALAGMLGEPGPGEPAERALAVEARDDAALLAEWLGELVWLAERERRVPARVLALELGENTARGSLEMRPAVPRHLVKAVTYHRLACRPAGAGWEATVVFDV